MQMHILGCGNAKSLSILRITHVVDKRANAHVIEQYWLFETN